jgi:hypothetical protein
MDPERNIEKLLRACAKKRRDDAGAPLPLHPATRRLLQAEVSRAIPKPADGGNVFARLFSALRPRMAFALCLVAVGLIAASALLPGLSKTKSKSEVQLARQDAPESAVETSKRFQPAAPMEDPAPPAPLAAARTRGTFKDAPERHDQAQPEMDAFANAEVGLDRANAAKAPATLSVAPAREFKKELNESPGLAGAAAPADADDKMAYGLELARKPAATPAPALSYDTLSSRSVPLEASQPPDADAGSFSFRTESVTAVPPDGKMKSAVDRAGGAPQPSAPTQQRFARAASAPSTERHHLAADTGTVLVAFDVEQVGQQLRIVDQDGSVYGGEMQLADALDGPATLDKSTALAEPAPASPAARRMEPSRERIVTGVETEQQPANNFAFRVSGLNRSLNQQVVFTGNIVVLTNGMQLGLLTNAGALGGRVQQAPAPPQSPLLNSRISGTVVINGQPEMQINAVPVER